jgi:hypothetical protein
MKITETQYHQFEHCMPRQHGNVSLSNLQVLNAILNVPSMAANGETCQNARQLAYHLYPHESLSKEWCS